MISNSGNFWELLNRSKVLPTDSVPSLAARYQSQVSGQPQCLPASEWLVKENVLSRFQADVIQGGFGERLRYANYTIYDRYSAGVDPYNTPWSVFKANHPETGHRLLLYFLSGDKVTSQRSWDSVTKSAQAWKKIETPELLPVLDILSLKEFRLIACDSFTGVRLSEKIPDQSRLAPSKSIRYARQILKIVGKLHQHDFVHGQLSLDALVLDESGSLRLLPPFLCNPAKTNSQDPGVEETKKDKLKEDNINAKNEGKDKTTIETQFLGYDAPEVEVNPNLKVQASDLFSIGVILHRMLAGKPPKRRHATPAANTSFELADPKKIGYDVELNDLVTRLLQADPSKRISDPVKIDALLAKHERDSEKKFPDAAPSRSLTDFREWMQRWRPDNEGPTGFTDIGFDLKKLRSDVDSSDKSSSDKSSSNSNETRSLLATEPESSRARKRRKSSPDARRQWLFTSVITASILSIITAFTYIGIQIGKSISETEVVNKSQDDDKGDQNNPTGTGVNSNPTNPSDAIANQPGGVFVQRLIDDTGNIPWQSPTTQPPIDFRLVPPSPQLVMTVRLTELLNTADGKLMIRSLGPAVQEFVASLPSFAGFAADEIESMTISLHSDTQKYQVAFRFQIAESLDEPTLVERWPTAEPKLSDGGNAYYQKDDVVYFYVKDENKKVSSFVVGPMKVLSPVIDSNGATRLDGVMGDLASKTDRQRHFSLMFLKSALSSEEGQKIITGPWARLNRSLTTRMDDRIRGVLFSAHIDEGTYLEMQLSNSVDFNVQDCKDYLNQQFSLARDQIDSAVSSTPGHPYWERVRIRFDEMISMMFRNTRIGIERQNVMVNCWLPEFAGHNLIAASEIALSATGDGGLIVGSPPSSKVSPKTIEELLATKRDLVDSNPPDLNILIENLKNDIQSDFRNLPFEFDIVLAGKDLEEDGITRNQRPTALDLKALPISEILTKVMFLANPEKNATGPADPLCKLVWVVVNDPADTNKKTIVITTRTSAAKNNYTLPEAFRPVN